MECVSECVSVHAHHSGLQTHAGMRSHRPVDRLVEHCSRHARQHEPISPRVHARRVLVEVAHADLAVLAAEGLAPLEECHPVMQHRRVDVERDERVGYKPVGTSGKGGEVGRAEWKMEGTKMEGKKRGWQSGE